MLTKARNRRGYHFKRNESVNLVHECVTYMDEISEIYGIYERNLEILGRLRRDFEFLEHEPRAEITRPHKEFGNNGKMMTEEIDWAVN